ncbi:MAG: low affinity iron permease family protein, partial [Alphaproteobacteria bacterium]
WAAGNPIAFGLALLTLLIWVGCGPFFNYSQGWQLVVNTGTTIITFLMVFVIQNSQNRDGLAAQIKLDEIIRAITGAKNSLIDLECLTDEELAELRVKFAEIADRARKDEEKIEKLNGKHSHKARMRTSGRASRASAGNGRNGSRSRAAA